MPHHCPSVKLLSLWSAQSWISPPKNGFRAKHFLKCGNTWSVLLPIRARPPPRKGEGKRVHFSCSCAVLGSGFGSEMLFQFCPLFASFPSCRFCLLFPSNFYLRHSRDCCQHLQVSELHQVALADLMPATPEEAKGLLRALDMVADDEIQQALDGLASCATK